MPKNTNLESNNDLATFMRPKDKLKGWEERVLACNSKNFQDYRYNLHKDDAEKLLQDLIKPWENQGLRLLCLTTKVIPSTGMRYTVIILFFS